mgnify:CR=1 FL=1
MGTGLAAKTRRRRTKSVLTACVLFAAAMPAAAQTQDHQYSAEDIQAALDRGAHPGDEGHDADDGEDSDGDAEHGGKAGHQHQPSHLGDDLLLLGVEGLFVLIGSIHGSRRVMVAGIAENETVVVADAEAGTRIDRVLAARTALSRTRLKALILDGAVTIGGRTIVDPGYRVNAGESIVVAAPEPEAAEPEGENIPLNVVFEDDQFIVIDKPADLVVHPAAGHQTGTLVNALIAHCGDSLSGIGGVKRPGIVHRLDKDTTGLMVVAKTDLAHQELAAQFADHGRTGPLQRAYLAIVWGVPTVRKGTVNAPLDRHPKARDKRAVRVRLTPAGIRLLSDLAGPLAQVHQRQLGHMSPGDLESLIRLIRSAGDPHEAEDSIWGKGHA